MTPQERELLGNFLQQLTQTQSGQKDADADAMIREAFSRRPDAAYLVVQRAMALEYSLQAAQAQAQAGSSNAWGRPAPAPAPAQAQAAAAPASSWGSGMLGTIATTAAGVVAGSFLFQGIQGLMGHRNAGEHAAANSAQLPPESPDPLVDGDDVADALDSGDFDSTDSV